MYGMDTGVSAAMTLTQFGEKLYNYIALPIGIIAIMFLILFGVSKVWSASWNIGIKITMILVVFVVELAAVFVLPFGIGSEARNLFSKLWGG